MKSLMKFKFNQILVYVKYKKRLWIANQEKHTVLLLQRSTMFRILTGGWTGIDWEREWRVSVEIFGPELI
jgi:hypothetical protein